MYNVIYVSVERIWPQVYSRCSFIFIFLLTDTICSCLSYCGCIVIPLFTSIIEENTLKAPLKRLSDSRSSHIWITNVAGSPRTEVMLVKGCEGTLTMVRWYRSSDVSIQHGSIDVGKYRPINRSSLECVIGESRHPLRVLVGHVRCHLLCHKMHRPSLNVLNLRKLNSKIAKSAFKSRRTWNCRKAMS